MARVWTQTDPSMDAAREAEESSTIELFERIYTKYRDYVYYLAYRYGSGDKAWAEDITQDIFVAFLRQLERGTEIRDVRGWLHRVTTNRCITSLRRLRFFEHPAVTLILRTRAHRPQTPEELGLVDERLQIVQNVLVSVTPKERACFYMYHVDGLTMNAIGETIGHTKGYVCKLLQRVERSIREAEAEMEGNRDVDD